MEEKQLVRVHRSEAKWRELVERQAQSGMTVGRFCQVEGVSEGGFYRWRRRLSGAAAGAFVAFTPEILGRGRVRAELDLGPGMVLRIFG